MSKIVIVGLAILSLAIFTSFGCRNSASNGEKSDGMAVSNVSCSIQSNPSKDGYIPNEETAIRVAEVIWIPIYGEDDVQEHRPYHAKLKDGKVWVVSGEVYTKKGGSPFALMQKSDGKILDVYHEE